MLPDIRLLHYVEPLRKMLAVAADGGQWDRLQLRFDTAPVKSDIPFKHRWRLITNPDLWTTVGIALTGRHRYWMFLDHDDRAVFA